LPVRPKADHNRVTVATRAKLVLHRLCGDGLNLVEEAGVGDDLLFDLGQFALIRADGEQGWTHRR
jgi:hypothetical protein